MGLMLEMPGDTERDVRLRLSDGSEVPARLTLLDYDGCEFESDHGFALGEQVNLHLYRMGSIRARITSGAAQVFEAEFLKDCPV